MSHWLDDVQLFAACNAPIRDETAAMHLNGDNHIQNFHLRRYIVGCTFRKSCFTAPLTDTPPQMIILNTVIP